MALTERAAGRLDIRAPRTAVPGAPLTPPDQSGAPPDFI